MAHRKAGGTTRLGRDSISKRLGVKHYGGEKVRAGVILIRQRGTKYHVGTGVKRGSDDTLYAKQAGVVKFTRRKKKKFDGSLKWTSIVNVV